MLAVQVQHIEPAPLGGSGKHCKVAGTAELPVLIFVRKLIAGKTGGKKDAVASFGQCSANETGAGLGQRFESPQHTVTLDAYYMDIYDVTVAKYKACVDVGQCSAPDTSVTCTSNMATWNNWSPTGPREHP